MVKNTGTVNVSGPDLDCLEMVNMSFWDQFCPPGTSAKSVKFYWEYGRYDDEDDDFRALVDWESI